jgi:hypothetical protein
LVCGNKEKIIEAPGEDLQMLIIINADKLMHGK